MGCMERYLQVIKTHAGVTDNTLQGPNKCVTNKSVLRIRVVLFVCFFVFFLIITNPKGPTMNKYGKT